jgi:hypothetical protein
MSTKSVDLIMWSFKNVPSLVELPEYLISFFHIYSIFWILYRLGTREYLSLKGALVEMK